MKISYRTAGAGSYVALADLASREFIAGFVARPQSELQVEPLFRAAHVKVFARGNLQWQIDFYVSREHASADAAAEFLATHRAVLPGLADLKVEVGAKTLYAHRAGLATCEPADESDKSTLFHYVWIAEQYSTAAPA